MDTVFIDRKGTELRINQGRLQIRSDNNEHQYTSLPLMQMRSLVISCDCHLSTSMLRSLSQYQVSLICLNHRNIEASMISIPSSHGNIQRKMKQYQLITQQDIALHYAKILVLRKIRLQRINIYRWRQQRSDLRSQLSEALTSLTQIHYQLKNITPTNNQQIMGFEGSAAKYYFSGYKTLFSDGLHFKKRNKRPPKDPVNACLSLTYTLLYYESLRTSYSAGLDPFLGLLHQISYGRASLACDLTELMRHEAEQWIYNLFRLQIIKHEHFSIDKNGACLLTKTGRKHYFDQYSIVINPWRNRLRKLGLRWAKTIDLMEYQHDIKEYPLL